MIICIKFLMVLLTTSWIEHKMTRYCLLVEKQKCPWRRQSNCRQINILRHVDSRYIDCLFIYCLLLYLLVVSFKSERTWAATLPPIRISGAQWETEDWLLLEKSTLCRGWWIMHQVATEKLRRAKQTKERKSIVMCRMNVQCRGEGCVAICQ